MADESELNSLREGATIVSPATPGGEGAVSIVRLSGPKAFHILSLLTSRPLSFFKPRTLTRADVRDGQGNLLDAALAVCFPGPRSFTGEDMAELHLHGSPAVVEAVIQAACAEGATPAAPGEFSRRAFQNGKMDLTQAEGLADLIVARTQAAASSALRQMRGAISGQISPIRESLLELLLTLETAIDFGDEDGAPQADSSQVCERVKEISGKLELLLRSYEKGRIYRDGAIIAITGVTNVGKSLLLNRLAGEDRAIVDDAPGTTRDFLQAEVAMGGAPVFFVDTAGLRDSADPVEQKGIVKSLEIIEQADFVLFVLDGSRAVEEADRRAFEAVREHPHLVVVNKLDLPAKTAGEEFSGASCGRGMVRVSAKTGEGIDGLVEAIARELSVGEGAVLAQGPLTRERHRRAVENAHAALARAGESAAAGMSPEFAAADVREASRFLAELVGEIAPEEILDEVFSRFCIGK